MVPWGRNEPQLELILKEFAKFRYHRSHKLLEVFLTKMSALYRRSRDEDPRQRHEADFSAILCDLQKLQMSKPVKDTDTRSLGETFDGPFSMVVFLGRKRGLILF